MLMIGAPVDQIQLSWRRTGVPGSMWPRFWHRHQSLQCGHTKGGGAWQIEVADLCFETMYGMQVRVHNSVGWSKWSAVRFGSTKKIAAQELRRLEGVLSHAVQSPLSGLADVASSHTLALLLAMALAKTDDGEDIPTLLKEMERRGMFAPEYSRAYSFRDADYGMRGAHHYKKPVGWVRYAIHVEQFAQYKAWCVAYHGTRGKSIVSILRRGLSMPGENGVAVVHGQAGSSSKRTIYVSPCIEYAAHPVYAQFVELAPNHWAQLVVQCRIRPGLFREQAQTLGANHWPKDLPYDPHYLSNEGMEWLVENPAHLIVTGLMVREFGPGADVKLYGETVSLVSRGKNGPDFEWTRLREKEFRQRGLTLAN